MMHWLMICRHHPGKDAERAAVRDQHRAHVLSGGGRVRVLIGSALTEDDGVAPQGNFGVIEAASREDVVAFAQDDPYAGLASWRRFLSRGLASTFQAHRIDPMTPAPAKVG